MGSTITSMDSMCLDASGLIKVNGISRCTMTTAKLMWLIYVKLRVAVAMPELQGSLSRPNG